MIVYYGVVLTPYFDGVLFPSYLGLNARLSSVVLNWMGQHTEASGILVKSSQFTLAVRRGCDAVEPSWLFCAVVLAFPAPFFRKIVGITIGTLFMQALNLLRIISLFFVGIHRPAWFNTVHLEIWPPVFIMLAIVLWIAWIGWAKPYDRQTAT